MSIGPKEDFTTAEEIVVQCSGGDDMPQDEGENLIKLLDEEEKGEE